MHRKDFKLLIVNLHLRIGGVETLLARLIPLLNMRGFEITLLIIQDDPDPELLATISKHCVVKFISREAIPPKKKNIERLLNDSYDLVFYTISQAVVLGSWFLNRIGKSNVSASLGIFQTELFCPPKSRYKFHHNIIRNILRDEIRPESLLFANTAGRDIHAKKLGTDLSCSNVIRLLVDVEKYRYRDRSGLVRRKIVSIGHFTPYKTYNFTMLPVVASLMAAGFPVEWHVYGEGELLEKFKSNIVEAKLSHVVFSHGSLKYSELESVLQDAFLFVGSGTSLIEASACGVPALTTIEYANGPVSYGYISEIQGYNLIEPGAEKRIVNLYEKILNVLEMNSADYAALQQACFLKANEYSGKSVIQEYVSFFETAKLAKSVIEVSTSRVGLYFLGAFLSYLINRLKIFIRIFFVKN